MALVLIKNCFAKINYYYHLSSANANTKSLNRLEYLFMIHFNIRSSQKFLKTLHYHISNLDYQPNVIALTETKLHENKLYLDIDIDSYKFIHKNSLTFAGGVGLHVKNPISFIAFQNINIDLHSVENLWIEIENLCRHGL